MIWIIISDLVNMASKKKKSGLKGKNEEPIDALTIAL